MVFMSRFVGVIPPVVTAFDADGMLNLEKTKAFIRHLIDKGVHGIFVAGSTGEYTLLSLEERKALFDGSVEAVDGKVPLLAGTGHNSTRLAIELSQHAEKAGADAVVASLPHYPKPTEKGLYMHYKQIADAVSIPVFVYNWPDAMGYSITPELVARLAEQGLIAGIKDSHANLDHAAEIFRLTHGKITVFAGWASKLLPALTLGLHGIIATAANALPEEVVAIYDLYQAGDMEKARQIHYKIQPFINAMELHPDGIKEAVRLLGHDVGPSRLPIEEAPPEVTAALRESLRELGKLR
jgi:4-hydroxy-tetrahydrodipicolinate synthase